MSPTRGSSSATKGAIRRLVCGDGLKLNPTSPVSSRAPSETPIGAPLSVAPAPRAAL